MPPPALRTHPRTAVLPRFCAEGHGLTMKCWCWCCCTHLSGPWCSWLFSPTSCLHYDIYTNWYIYLFCRPPRLRIQRMAFSNGINVGGWCFCTHVIFIGVDKFLLLLVYSLHYFILPTTDCSCNPWLLRWRAWLNDETNVGSGRCCPHLFGPWCSPATQGLLAGAHRSTRKLQERSLYLCRARHLSALGTSRQGRVRGLVPVTTHPCKLAHDWSCFTDSKLFERSEFLIDTSQKKSLHVCRVPCAVCTCARVQ